MEVHHLRVRTRREGRSTPPQGVLPGRRHGVASDWLIPNIPVILRQPEPDPGAPTRGSLPAPSGRVSGAGAGIVVPVEATHGLPPPGYRPARRHGTVRPGGIGLGGSTA